MPWHPSSPSPHNLVGYLLGGNEELENPPHFLPEYTSQWSRLEKKKKLQGKLDLRLETDGATGPAFLSQHAGMKKSHLVVWLLQEEISSVSGDHVVLGIT